MNADDSANRAEVGAEDSFRRPTPAERRFSLRSLLIVTAVVSIVMALGTHLAGIAFAVLVVVLIQAAMLLSADWLIRPANRRILAFVAAGSWIILGSGLLIIGLKSARGFYSPKEPTAAIAALVICLALAASCYAIAWRRWRRLTASHRAE